MVLAAIALTPSAPVLVPELAGAAADEVAVFRDAAIAVAAGLPDCWIAIGAGPATQVFDPDSRGTFAGYGVDVPVTLAPDAPGAPVALAPLPLCALIAGWLRGQANRAARVQVRVYDSALDGADAVELGRELRADIDARPEDIGVLVVADGFNTLTAAAPGGFDPEAEAAQSVLDDALAAGDAAALTRLPDAIIGRVAYQVLAGLTEQGRSSATQFARGAPYGVGYFVGRWGPGESTA